MLTQSTQATDLFLTSLTTPSTRDSHHPSLLISFSLPLRRTSQCIMLATLRIATHNVQARLDITASCTYASSNKIHIVHITEPYPQHHPPSNRNLTFLHREATSLGYTLHLTKHSAFLYNTAALKASTTSVTTSMDGRIHTLTLSQRPHPDIRLVGIYAHANPDAHTKTKRVPHPPR